MKKKSCRLMSFLLTLAMTAGCLVPVLPAAAEETVPAEAAAAEMAADELPAAETAAEPAGEGSPDAQDAQDAALPGSGEEASENGGPEEGAPAGDDMTGSGTPADDAGSGAEEPGADDAGPAGPEGDGSAEDGQAGTPAEDVTGSGDGQSEMPADNGSEMPADGAGDEVPADDGAETPAGDEMPAGDEAEAPEEESPETPAEETPEDDIPDEDAEAEDVPGEEEILPEDAEIPADEGIVLPEDGTLLSEPLDARGAIEWWSASILFHIDEVTMYQENEGCLLDVTFPCTKSDVVGPGLGKYCFDYYLVAENATTRYYLDCLHDPSFLSGTKDLRFESVPVRLPAGVYELRAAGLKENGTLVRTAAFEKPLVVLQTPRNVEYKYDGDWSDWNVYADMPEFTDASATSAAIPAANMSYMSTIPATTGSGSGAA